MDIAANIGGKCQINQKIISRLKIYRYMKNIKNFLVILLLIMIFVSCSSKCLNLFDTISVQLPSILTKDLAKENCFINSENGVSLSFTMTKNKSFGELLPRVGFDFLYNSSLLDSTIVIKHKETREISGLKVGIVEKSTHGSEIKTFFTEVNNEILMGELKGDIRNSEYMSATFNEILNSIKKK
jgi:hypothetical protein